MAQNRSQSRPATRHGPYLPIRLTHEAALELLLTSSPTNPVATRAEWSGCFR